MAPGGSTSNLFTLWARGNVALSVAMSAASTTCALFMLPLLYLLYVRVGLGLGDALDLPVVNIVIALLTIVVPEPMEEPGDRDAVAMPAAEWQPLDDAGTPAASGCVGRWLTEASDLAATDAEARVAMWSSDRLPLRFPQEWPAAFKSAPLRRLLNKSMLNGVRCRAVPPPTAAEHAAAAGVVLEPLHSFSNAERVAAASGWAVVKGFWVFELADAPPSASFVAVRHWWNATSSGGWVDLTPRLSEAAGEEPRSRLLVESALGDKAADKLTAAGRDFAGVKCRQECRKNGQRNDESDKRMQKVRGQDHAQL
ncbi:hypothetical protein EMIHUDRAFT_226312 [Emiliania huxleyi CCMP1516]|uniref:Uncharacterized protein n=2 Tax=Emiliania huxleyi TaxID=2903 RepID=A0A0D3KLA0_EMIH1|nr:hypothetical protein EMIHUDRAFT_226312 [Emiliania huxleyi CCMP1516]EOD36535.1 hypothetical protein EMIHUDRAFT_226312 [Emiliania huxleyi CCMP1516]|eukprot:XP_005788964.1 hypothetical protein EMIHUDRAFT_226312 [Emiliania huxleyi CCMP1516]